MVSRGSGRMKVDDEIVELKEWDAVRPARYVARLRGRPEGLEILVIGAPNLGEARAKTSMASATGGLTRRAAGSLDREVAVGGRARGRRSSRPG